jgi:FkbM family methyltransferase
MESMTNVSSADGHAMSHASHDGAVTGQLMRPVTRVAKQVARTLMAASFSRRPYTIKQVKRFGREMALYIDQHSCQKIYLGWYEKEETAFLQSEVRPSDVCLDVGANTGYFTLLFASLAAKVVAIEPIEQNVALIRLSAALNSDRHIQVIQAAVADQVGEGDFVQTTQSSLSRLDATGAALGSTDRDEVDVVAAYKVPILSIDSLGLDRLDIVKMDIEGHEYIALRGMEETLDRLKPRLLMIELVEAHLQQVGSSIVGVLDLLASHGYQPRVLSNKGLVNYVGQPIPNDNLFFTRP